MGIADLLGGATKPQAADGYKKTPGKVIPISRISDTEAGKVRMPGSAIELKRKVSVQDMRKNIGRTVRVNGKEMKIEDLRDELAGLAKKYSTRGITGEKFKKILRDEYRMDVKTRKKVVRAVARHWATPGDGGLSVKKRERLRRLNVAMYNIQRDRETGQHDSAAGRIKSSREDRVGGVLTTASGEKTSSEHLGVQAQTGAATVGQAIGARAADGYNEQSRASAGARGTKPPTSLTGQRPGNVAPISNINKPGPGGMKSGGGNIRLAA